MSPRKPHRRTAAALLLAALLCATLLPACSDEEPPAPDGIQAETPPDDGPQPARVEHLAVPGGAESYRELFHERPLPVWMQQNLETAGIVFEIGNVEWTELGTDGFRGVFSLTLRAGGEAVTLDGLTVDMAQTSVENGFEATVRQHAVWAGDCLLAAADGRIEVYDIVGGPLSHRATLEFGDLLDGEALLFPTYFQEIAGSGYLLAVTVREGETDRMTVLSAYDQEFELRGRSAVEHYAGLDHGWEAQTKPYYALNDLTGGLYELHPVGTERAYPHDTDPYSELGSPAHFLRVEEGAAAAWQQMTCVFDDSGLSRPGSNFLLYEKAAPPTQVPEPRVGEAHRHLALLVAGSARQGCLIRSYEMDYDPDSLGEIVQSLNFGGWNAMVTPPGERLRPCALTYLNRSVELAFPTECVTIAVDLDGALTLRVEYDESLLRQKNNRLVDASPDGRFQIWKVRVRPLYEGQRSTHVLYDSETGTFHDFGHLGEVSVTLSFYDDRNLAVLAEQTVRTYDPYTGTLRELPIDLGEFADRTELYAYAHDPAAGRHALLVGVVDELSNPDWPVSRNGQELLNLVVFDANGTVLSARSTGVRYLEEAAFVPAPVTLRVWDGDFWFYSTASDRCYLFSDDVGEAAQIIDGAALGVSAQGGGSILSAEQAEALGAAYREKLDLIALLEAQMLG